MVILEKLIIIGGIVFVAFIITMIITVTLDYFNVNLDMYGDKKIFNKGMIVTTIILSICIAISIYRGDNRDNIIFDYINHAQSLEELKESLEEKEIFEKSFDINSKE